MAIHFKFQLLLGFVAATVFLSTDALRVVMVTPCQSGHITPASGLIRQLLAKGHEIDLIVTDDCCATINNLLKNVTNCYSKVLFASTPVVTNSQINSVMSPKNTEIYAEMGVKKIFDFVQEVFRADDNYDVMINGYMMIGAHLAAKLHNIPVVTYYVGPLPLPLADEPYERKGFLFFPESILPGFLFSFYDVFSLLYWQRIISNPSVKYIEEIEAKYDIQPCFSNTGVDFMLPFSYYYMMSNIVQLSPPDLTLPNLNFMKRNTNVHHVGFIPDEEYLKPLSAELENFLEHSRRPVVYMSLGTVFALPTNELEKLVDEFAKQDKYCIVWSASNKYYSALKERNVETENFKLVSKVPQLTMILHQKVKVFITHAGSNSLQEGVYSETPMLVFPGFGDQPVNSRSLVQHNVALPLTSLTFTEISKKLDLILDAGTYSKMKATLAESKKLMTSLGGFGKAAEIVQQVATGDIQVNYNPDRLFNPIKECYQFLFMNGVIFLAIFYIAIRGCLFCCRATPKKAKTN